MTGSLKAQAPEGPDTTSSTTEDSTGKVTGITPGQTITVGQPSGAVHIPAGPRPPRRRAGWQIHERWTACGRRPGSRPCIIICATVRRPWPGSRCSRPSREEGQVTACRKLTFRPAHRRRKLESPALVYSWRGAFSLLSGETRWNRYILTNISKFLLFMNRWPCLTTIFVTRPPFGLSTDRTPKFPPSGNELPLTASRRATAVQPSLCPDAVARLWSGNLASPAAPRGRPLRSDPGKACRSPRTRVERHGERLQGQKRPGRRHSTPPTFLRAAGMST